MWLKHHGKPWDSSSPLDLILGGPVPFLFGVFAIQNGWISGRYAGEIYREDAPVQFWLCVIIWIAVGTGMFLWGLREAFQTKL
jgi:hypothetical protein